MTLIFKTYPSHLLSFGQKIQCGVTSEVWEASHPSTNDPRALKLVRCAHKESFTCERQALERLPPHPHIIQLHSSHDAETHKGVDVSILELEFAPRGALIECIQRAGPLLPLVGKTYTSQLVSAISLCHLHGIAHRDIKLDNLLLADDWSLRVADFGSANLDVSTHPTRPQKIAGTHSYMAPELLRLAANQGAYANPRALRHVYDAEKVDVWAIGIVAFILLVGHPPFKDAASGDYYFRFVAAGNWDRFWLDHGKISPGARTIDRDARDFIEHALNLSVHRRPSVEELKVHPWLQSCTLTAEELASGMEVLAGVADP